LNVNKLHPTTFVYALRCPFVSLVLYILGAFDRQTKPTPDCYTAYTSVSIQNCRVWSVRVTFVSPAVLLSEFHWHGHVTRD